MGNQEPETPGLNRDAVIQAAMEMLDTVGVEGLSMRALADRLGVKAASLYWHLRDKEQLLDMVAAAVLDQIEVPVAPPGWRPQVSAACNSLASLLGEHRATAAVVLDSLRSVQRSRLTRDMARALQLAGLEDAEAAAFALVIAAASSAAAAPAAGPRPPAGEAMRLEIESGSWRVTVRAAPPGAVDVAASGDGRGAASLPVQPGGVVRVHNRRSGFRGPVELNPEYTWYVKVHSGTWNTSLDLTGLRVSGIELDSGSGNVTCALPAPAGIVPIRVNSGIVGVTMHRPRNTAVHATIATGNVKVRLDDQAIRAMGADVVWDSAGAARSDNRYDLTVYSGCVRVSIDATGPAAPPLPQRSGNADGAASTASTDQGVALILDGIEKRLADRPSGGASGILASAQ